MINKLKIAARITAYGDMITFCISFCVVIINVLV